ncbi:hypothetical protein [Staphylococcus hyicus]|uniref:Uncharacterized protein n=1 Tax=Staphylococcus hyicus TaxID=1284 RepID=A0ACD5FRF1_STAHY|nr:hypothetical protein [Staphylococcus hyicus]MDP4464492.1 hypothetical protein [Staphylococcus hyicus]
MAILYIILTGLVFSLTATGSKWIDGKIIKKRTGKSNELLKNDKKNIFITFILYFLLGVIAGYFIFE